MKIELRERTAGHVRIYFEQTQDEQIERMLPRSVESLEQALANFEATLLPGAASFGRTIYADGRYIGDVWCYCIDCEQSPNAMLSYCIFDKALWGKGAATEAVGLFAALGRGLHLCGQQSLDSGAGKERLCRAGILCGERQGVGLSGARLLRGRRNDLRNG